MIVLTLSSLAERTSSGSFATPPGGHCSSNKERNEVRDHGECHNMCQWMARWQIRAIPLGETRSN